jgi:hypothetical protein
VNLPPSLTELMNKVDDGYVVFAHFVKLYSAGPGRIGWMRFIRVIATTNFQTFRVEQLVRTNTDNFNAQGTWRTLSTHGGQTPGEMLDTAMQAAAAAQARLAAKIVARKRKLIRV